MELLEKNMFMDNTRLELKSIYKNFGNVVALKNISMTTNSGQINCILGDNGAGKSTLVNIISGVFKQSKGQYKINGETVSFLNRAAKLNSKIYSKTKTNCIKCNGVGYLRISLDETRTCLCCYGKGFLMEEIQRF